MSDTAGQAVEAGMAEVNGTRLYYEARGRGPALLLVHGFTLDLTMWEPQARALGDRFRVVAYDARGFGRSAMPGEAPYRHCDDAAALCEHLGLRRVIAVGHSAGAHRALELALARPDLVGGLAAICPSALGGVPFTPDLVALFAAVEGAARGEGLAAAKAIWARAGWFAPARERPALAAALDRMLDAYSGWHWTHANPAVGLEPPPAQRLAELRVPVLVVSGGRDLAYNDAITRALLAAWPGARRLHLPDAGHMASMEEPEAVTAAIAELGGQAGRAMTVVALSGSLRAGSSNAELLRAAAALAPDGMRIDLYDGIGTLPHFNPDLDPEGAVPPPPVRDFRARLRAADGVIISCPEYAHGVPGAFKNALDWVVSSGELSGKPVLLLNASGGGGQVAQASLVETLSVIEAGVLSEGSRLAPFIRRRLDAAGIVADADVAGAVKASLDALSRAIVARRDDGSSQRE